LNESLLKSEPDQIIALSQQNYIPCPYVADLEGAIVHLFWLSDEAWAAIEPPLYLRVLSVGRSHATPDRRSWVREADHFERCLSIRPEF
jgi:hypothetical protein